MPQNVAANVTPTVNVTTVLEDWQLGPRYQRAPISAEEIEYINVGLYFFQAKCFKLTLLYIFNREGALCEDARRLTKTNLACLYSLFKYSDYQPFLLKLSKYKPKPFCTGADMANETKLLTSASRLLASFFNASSLTVSFDR